MQATKHLVMKPMTQHTAPSQTFSHVSANDSSSFELDEHGIGILTMRGRGSLNILDRVAISQISTTIDALAQKPEIKVLILRGQGERALIGGADIHDMHALDPQSAKIFISSLRDLCDACYHFPGPVIARLAGYCLGGGLELAMACDLRIAGHEALLGMPEVKVGIPSVIHASLLPRLIGQARSTWMLLTGELIDAKTALGWGLIHELYEEDQLDAMIWKRALSLASMGQSVLRQQKRLMHAWQDQTLRQSIEQSIGEFANAFETDEPKHFMGEFLNRKRKS